MMTTYNTLSSILSVKAMPGSFTLIYPSTASDLQPPHALSCSLEKYYLTLTF